MAAKPAVLRLNGKPFSLERPNPSAQKARAFLNRASKHDIFTTDQISQKAGIALSVVRSIIASKPELDGYSLKVGAVRYWGHPAAIKVLRSRVEQ